MQAARGTPWDIPARNEILEVVTPFDFEMGFILQLGNRMLNDIGKKVNQVISGMRTIAFLSEREAVLSNFKEGDAK